MIRKPVFNKLKSYSGFELPVSVIVPAFNEEKTIIETVYALMQLNYPEYEIIVVNDGSRDKTLKLLIETFDLVSYPATFKRRLETKKIHKIYQSTQNSRLIVIDKENGGKSDALNVGIDISKYPLYCCIDADSILNTDSMNFVVSQFLDDPRTIACGGTIRLANGCKITKGVVREIGLPKNILALIQTIEYLRAFLFGRLGWVPLNSLLIVSGSFSIFSKEAVLNVDGYSTDTIGEDMELIVRLHHYYRTNRIPYRIVAIPEPIAFTEAPEDLKSLRSQRIRWQRGLCESLARNIDLLYHPRGGLVGWVGFPALIIFELLGPLIEILGYVFFIVGFFVGIISYQALIAFLVLSVGFSLFISIVTIVLEEISFKIYPKTSSVVFLLLAALMENLGFRQINTFWRLEGFLSWVFRRRRGWGTIRRRGTN
jgi:cellulose synthase/poly-beta-1,6-N-acetylglucosamine synthase-like glycosyltransferase